MKRENPRFFQSYRQPELWSRHSTWKGLDPEAEKIVLQHYHDDGSGKAPRYYQVNAINAAIKAMAKLSTHSGTIERDVEGYRPEKGQLDREGEFEALASQVDEKSSISSDYWQFRGIALIEFAIIAHCSSPYFSRSSRAVG